MLALQIQLIGSLEDAPGETASPAAASLRPAAATAPGQSPSPIVIVPQPKPRHTTMR